MPYALLRARLAPAACLLFSALLLVVHPAVALAQSESGGAAVRGVVQDPDGKVVANATVVVRQESTGYVRALLSDSTGRFSAAGMPVGTYTVEISATGFAPQRRTGVELRVGQTQDVAVKLALGAMSEQVTVSAEATRLDPTSASVNATIDAKAISDLPIRGRNFMEFVQLTPGVMQEANRSGIVVNGQRSINSNISIDGVDFNDSLQGNQRGGNDATFSFPQSAIREFQVVRTGASSEVGRTNAGFVNVVTKNGTNAFSGESFYANRSGRLTSRDAYGNSSINNSQHQMGGAVGGPIARDHTFFFASMEKNLLTIPYTVKFSTPSGGAVVPAAIASQEGQFTGKNNPLVGFARVDTNLNATNRLNIQYTYNGLGGLNFNVKSALTNQAVTNNNTLDRTSQGVKGAVTSVWSPRLLNEVRVQGAYDNRYQRPVSTLPQIDIKDLGTIGGNSDGPIDYKATRVEVLDNVTWTAAAHTVRAGMDFNYSPQYMTREKNGGGLYSFSTLNDYLIGKINQFQQAIPAAGARGYYQAAQTEYAAYVQDAIKVRSTFTVTAALRWDGQVNPQPDRPNPAYPITAQIPNDLTMWQPRLGLAWDLSGRGTTMVRASSGYFDSRTPGYLMQRVFTDNGLDVLNIDSKIDASILSYLTIPDGLTAIPAGVALPLNSIYAFDPNFKNPRSLQNAVSFEQQLGRNTRVTVSYARNRTRDLQRRVDKNLFAPTINAAGVPIYPTTSAGVPIRPDPAIGQLNVNESSAHALYNGVSLELTHRLSHRVQLQANYTYAVAKDDDSNERDFNRQQVLNTFDYNSEWGYSRQDIRHNGKFNVMYDLPGGFTVSTIVLARTGIPYKAVIGSDLNGDGNSNNDRPVINGQLVGRNVNRQPSFFDADLRILKTVGLSGGRRVVLSLEVFNLTRASNKGMDGDGESVFGKPTTTVNPVTGLFFANNTAGLPTTSPSTDRFGGPRQVQLGLRFVF